MSVHKEIKYVKRSRSSFDDFSAKHTPCATLNKLFYHWRKKNNDLVFLFQTDVCMMHAHLAGFNY